MGNKFDDDLDKWLNGEDEPDWAKNLLNPDPDVESIPFIDCLPPEKREAWKRRIKEIEDGDYNT